LGCPESSCRKRFKFNKCILKFKSSAFQFSFKIGTNFPDNPIAMNKTKNNLSLNHEIFLNTIESNFFLLILKTNLLKFHHEHSSIRPNN